MPLSLEDRIRTGCLFLQNSFEKAFLKSGLKHRVDEGVEGGVSISEPQEDGKERGIWHQSWIEGHQQGHDEEGQPAHDEDAGDDDERLGCLLLPLRLEMIAAFLTHFRCCILEKIIKDHLENEQKQRAGYSRNQI
ncbi:hypothetical protein HNY73_019093 [Argiope bruennichi]|uniref:Uncharacterized protein n=1 Tax=Argiope bruennichi TaxID=94029 RepID=A0A8T0EGH9_ARGBR|nr:hypothetical protein HNY73_019093 [Argiope bruennichi]